MEFEKVATKEECNICDSPNLPYSKSECRFKDVTKCPTWNGFYGNQKDDQTIIECFI